EGFSLPGLEDDLERFEEPRLALFVGDAERIVRTRAAAAADPEVETPLAQVIECRDLTGHAERVVQRKKLHGRSHPQASRSGHDPARHQQRRRQDRAGGVDEHLRQPHDVEPPRLARVDELEELAERVALTGTAPYLLREDSEVHALSLSPRSGSLRANRGAILLRRRPRRQGARWHRHSSFPRRRPLEPRAWRSRAVFRGGIGESLNGASPVAL